MSRNWNSRNETTRIETRKTNETCLEPTCKENYILQLAHMYTTNIDEYESVSGAGRDLYLCKVEHMKSAAF